MRVLVTGGTGYLGRAVVTALASAPFEWLRRHSGRRLPRRMPAALATLLNFLDTLIAAAVALLLCTWSGA